MFLNDFESNSTKFKKIQKYLKENFNYEIKTSGLTVDKVTKMIFRAEQKMNSLKENSREYTKLHMISEGLKTWHQVADKYQTELTRTSVSEGIDDAEIETAKVILAAQEMTDKIQKMIEDIAKMQVQDLLPIVDAMKMELGVEQADHFNTSADQAMSTLMDSLKSAKDEMGNAIAVAQGNEPASDMMQSDEFSQDDTLPMGDEEEESDYVDGTDLGNAADDFDAMDDLGMSEPEGRRLKDSYNRKGNRIDDTFFESLNKMRKSAVGGKIPRRDLEEMTKKMKLQKKR